MNSSQDAATLSSLLKDNLDIFACPVCGGELEVTFDDPEGMICKCCDRPFQSEQGIPLLFVPNQWDDKADVTEIVKEFYEETPFPNYDGLDSDWSLREKAEKGVFARLLDEQVPLTARILEVGCGTGQLSNFLGLKWGRTVFGADLCLNSLKLAHGFKQKNKIDNVAFLQMNLFRPVFKPGSFDLVICNGVLHHTSDPFLGFQSIAPLVKEGGHIIIGLYNTFGRLTTDFRRFIFKISGNRLGFLDPRLRDNSIDEIRKHTWFMDQYKHPHESKQTIGEALRWFDGEGFEFVTGIPKVTAFDSFAPNEELFASNPRGTALDHFMVQAGMLLTGGKEGGFFVTIGRKVFSQNSPVA